VSLPEMSIRRPVATLMLLASIVVLGVIAVLRLPVAFMPEFERPVLFVRVPYPGATPEQVERSIVRRALPHLFLVLAVLVIVFPIWLVFSASTVSVMLMMAHMPKK